MGKILQSGIKPGQENTAAADGPFIVKAIQESMNQKYGVVNYENGVEFWFELEKV